jgi:hypothetical protein
LRVRYLLAACGLVFMVTRCGGPEPIPAMNLFALPRVIHDQGAKSTISVEVSDDQKQQRPGTVSISATAGSFQGAGNTASVELSKEGLGELEYTCVKATDPNCTGPVRLEATWSHGEEFLVQVIRVDVVPADAGVRDGGVRDGGP